MRHLPTMCVIVLAACGPAVTQEASAGPDVPKDGQSPHVHDGGASGPPAVASRPPVRDDRDDIERPAPPLDAGLPPGPDDADGGTLPSGDAGGGDAGGGDAGDGGDAGYRPPALDPYTPGPDVASAKVVVEYEGICRDAADCCSNSAGSSQECNVMLGQEGCQAVIEAFDCPQTCARLYGCCINDPTAYDCGDILIVSDLRESFPESERWCSRDMKWVCQ